MTRMPPRPFPAPSNVDLGKTRSRFLFAREQACAHAAAADYLRVRETSGRAGSGVTMDPDGRSSGGYA